VSNVRFRQGIVCDDIRQEMNGKFIIIGMYSASFVPARLPVATQIAFGVWAEVEGAGTYKCNFELSLEPDGSPVGSVELEFQMPAEEKEIFIPLPKFPVNIGSPGHIVLKEKLSGQEVIRLKISPPSSVPEQPVAQSPSGAPH